MVLYRLVLCCSWLILSWIASAARAEKRTYMSFDMKDQCFTSRKPLRIRTGSQHIFSTGVLKVTNYLSEEQERECVAKIIPPTGYGIWYVIEKMELRTEENNDCRDYIKIYNETLSINATSPVCRCCRFSESGDRCEAFCGRDNSSALLQSSGGSRVVKVLFHSRGGPRRREDLGFSMIFTTYKLSASCAETEFQCENGPCISNFFTCDGINNCGDMSDENVTRCAGFTDPMKAVIVASAVVVTVFLGVMLAYLPKMHPLHNFFGWKQHQPPTYYKQRPAAAVLHKTSLAPLIKKTSNTKSVSFQTPLPRISEDSFGESQV